MDTQCANDLKGNCNINSLIFQIKTTKAQSRKWAKDDEVTDCSNCTKTFTVTIRKVNHCFFLHKTLNASIITSFQVSSQGSAIAQVIAHLGR